MQSAKANVASQLTPTGTSAIAVIGIRGPEAAEALTPFQPDVGGEAGRRFSVARLPVGRVRFGYWYRTDGTREEVVLVRTAEQCFELHCHGGPIIVGSLLADLERRGCQIVPWEEFLLHECPSPWERDLWRLLSRATTAQAASCILDQASGALANELLAAAEALERQSGTEAAARIEELLRRSRLARRFFDPWRVTLLGPPNVGKSSLANALVGYERTIVWEEPGTTRDVVAVEVALDGWPLVLQDVAGLRATDDPVEQEGVERARAEAARSDLVLLVTSPDAGSWPTVTLPAHVHVLFVLNKVDLLGEPRLWLTELAPPGIPAARVCLTSALTGQGISELQQSMVRALVGDSIPPGAGVPLTGELCAGLEEAAKLVAEGRHSAGRLLLRSLAERAPAIWKAEPGLSDSCGDAKSS
ncbi:MAG: tRNA modification GTPase MnmE [Pirellulaceae bacterium]|nr:MAG: tRNA modification GTPase MnmE [Pirellulaceae bacterium]